MADVEMGGRVGFYIAANVTPSTMSEWSAQKIKDFFSGMAQVVQAAGERASVEFPDLITGDTFIAVRHVRKEGL